MGNHHRSPLGSKRRGFYEGRSNITEHVFHFLNHRNASNLVGALDNHLTHIQNKLSVVVLHRSGQIVLRGRDSKLAGRCLELLDSWATMGQTLDLSSIDAAIHHVQEGERDSEIPVIVTRCRRIQSRTLNQARLIVAVRHYSLVFATGPAGTGKTYLAVAAGVESLLSGAVDRLILCRPAIEAGERLGFLPGDMREKVDPFMRPLFDALHDFVTVEQMNRRLARGDIEIIPLAYMRGRTLDHAFIIVDEAQNASIAQMKMVLTRLGHNSRMIVTGDPDQTDRVAVAGRECPGFQDAIERLEHVQDVSVVRFHDSDSVRHPLVKQILASYRAPIIRENTYHSSRS